jgi:alpha-glucosidase
VADAERLCVERQAGDPRSILTLVRRLGELRRRTPVLQIGAQRSLDAGTDVLAWLREGGGDRLLAAVNFATTPVRFRPRAEPPSRAALVISTDPDRSDGEVSLSGLELRPSEGLLLRLS